MAQKQLEALKKPFNRGQLLQHIDGGFYRYQETVYSAQDQSQKAVYKHVYPFTVAKWEREVGEFISKFSIVSEEVLKEAKKLGRKAMQEKIVAHKEARRKAEKS